jgi:hypothetical protein
MKTNNYIARKVKAQIKNLLPQIVVLAKLNRSLANKLSIVAFLLTLKAVAQPEAKSLNFSGNGLVYFTENDLQLTNNNEMAIGAWVNWSDKTNAAPGAVIFSIMDSTGNDGQFWLEHCNGNNSFQFSIKTDQGQKVTLNSVTNPIPGNWYFVLGVFRDTKVELYVNGLLEAQDSVTPGSLINPYNPNFKGSLGNNIAMTKGFNGMMDEVFVRNNFSVDSAAAIKMMLIQMTGQETALYDYWSIDSVRNDSIIDAGIIGSTGVCVNAPVTGVDAPSGNVSDYVPPVAPVPNPSFVYYGLQNDSLVINNFSGGTVPDGIYVYVVYGTPADSLTPSGITPDSINYYYGVFVPDYAGGSYQTTYYFSSGTTKRTSSLSAQKTLLERNSASPIYWVSTGQIYNGSGAPLSVVSSSQWTEFTVGSLNSMNVSSNNLEASGTTYPNPFSSGFQLNLTCKKSSNLKMVISNVSGTVVYEGNRSCFAGENNLNFENLGEVASGIYFLTVADESGNVANFKMIKN